MTSLFWDTKKCEIDIKFGWVCSSVQSIAKFIYLPFKISTQCAIDLSGVRNALSLWNCERSLINSNELLTVQFHSYRPLFQILFSSSNTVGERVCNSHYRVFQALSGRVGLYAIQSKPTETKNCFNNGKMIYKTRQCGHTLEWIPWNQDPLPSNIKPRLTRQSRFL